MMTNTSPRSLLQQKLIGNTEGNNASIKNKIILFMARLAKAGKTRQTYTSSGFIDKVQVLGHFPKDAGLQMLLITVPLL